MTTQQITLPREVVEAALEDTRKTAMEVFKDSCNHTKDAIEFFAAEMGATLRAALQAQAAAEPVAYRYRPFAVFKRDADGNHVQSARYSLMDTPEHIDAHSSMCGAVVEPLYTTPQPAPDTQAAINAALEALKHFRSAGYGNSTDYNRQCEAFNLSATAIAALEKVVKP